MRAIVHREMQVAARRKGTYLFRAVAAAIGLALTGIFFVIQEEANATGRLLFWMLAISGCVFSVREGFHRAAVSLSEERANGTLGLLFLTTLKGFDVVLGKFASASLQAFQMAAVAIPLLAVSLMVGGVSITEIARAALCLVNLTFCYIALSILVSSITASEVSSMSLSFFLLVGITAIGCFWQEYPTLETIGMLNPILSWYLISDAPYTLHRSQFWMSLLLSHVAGWIVLWLTALFLQRTWPKPEVFPKLAILWTRRKRVKKARRSTRILGDSAPLEWLLLRNIFPRAPLYFVLACIAASFAVGKIFQDDEGAVIVAVLTMILLALSLTIHASITVARARKSGLLELVAIAPLSNFDLVKTIIAGLRRAFLAPALVITLWLATFLEWKKIPQEILHHQYDSILPLYYLLTYLLMLWTVTYMGIWMALKEKGPARAFLRTLFLAIVFPWIMSPFLAIPFDFELPWSNFFYWFIVGNVARQTVRTEFRELVLSRPQKPPPFPIINKS